MESQLVDGNSGMEVSDDAGVNTYEVQIHQETYEALKAMGSFKSATASDLLSDSGPLPLPPTGSLRNFQYDEIVAACHNFSSDRCMSECISSTIYKASLGDDVSISKRFEAIVTRLHPSTQRMLVYERLYHGSLERLLYGRSDGPSINWNTRMKIAMCVAQDLRTIGASG